ncbi:MAG: hypothetical protein IJV35_04280 [Neisseriaceae bacterium]|nr:hypothetical protein [Neisseriaceae bacterium]
MGFLLISALLVFFLGAFLWLGSSLAMMMAALLQKKSITKTFLYNKYFILFSILNFFQPYILIFSFSFLFSSVRENIKKFELNKPHKHIVEMVIILILFYFIGHSMYFLIATCSQHNDYSKNIEIVHNYYLKQFSIFVIVLFIIINLLIINAKRLNNKVNTFLIRIGFGFYYYGIILMILLFITTIINEISVKPYSLWFERFFVIGKISALLWTNNIIDTSINLRGIADGLRTGLNYPDFSFSSFMLFLSFMILWQLQLWYFSMIQKTTK